MKLIDFNNWTKIHYNLDCYKNDLFEASLNSIYSEFESAKFNGIPFFEYYKGEDLYNEFFDHYISRIEMLLNMIPDSNSIVSMNVHGINLNKYLNNKEELLKEVLEAHYKKSNK
ncbi:MAG: hypothetical protein KKG25_03695 [Bacteroidetes bacterium]|nr:hypothetical protein [Bacteroidota bacterium]MBU1483948.1 hypothetical protein [Bacteroidota bacterium]MBU2374553.1 hypothetical protein [Bacteroidota bacterium]